MPPTFHEPGRSRAWPIAAATLLFVLAAPVASDAQQLERTARVDELFSRFDRPGSPGCAVGVAENGSLIHQRGYGMANLDHGVPLTPQSVFYIASVAKQFSAATMALLADRGLISLDDDVRRYVPELPDYGAVITVRQLVHHTSGLRDYLTLMNLAGMRVEDVHSDQAVLDLVVRQNALNFAPGSEYLYSNTGYFLMSVIVNRVTGRSFRQFADEAMFQPLGMRNTHFHDDRTMIVPNRVISYAPRGEGFRQDYWANFEKVGSGGLLTSVEDLHRWDQNFDADRLGSDRLMDVMHTRGVLSSGDTLEYAFGMNVGHYRGLRTVRHGGSSMGFRAHLLRFPEQRFSVITLCNVGTVDAAALSQQIADIYLDGRFPAPPPRADASVGNAAAAQTTVAASASELRDLVGDYHSAELRTSYAVAERAGTLYLLRPAAEDTELRPGARDTFHAGRFEVRFTRDDRGRISGMELDAGRVRNIGFTRG